VRFSGTGVILALHNLLFSSIESPETDVVPATQLLPFALIAVFMVSILVSSSCDTDPSPETAETAQIMVNRIDIARICADLLLFI